MIKAESTGTVARPSTFWMGVAAIALTAAVSFRQVGLLDVIDFLVITASALLPIALWCHGRAHGLPLYPIFALGTIGTFALPLIAHHPLVMEYSVRERSYAAFTIAATNLCGTAPWFWLTRRRTQPRHIGYELRRSIGLHFFLGVLLAATAFNLEQLALMERLDPAVFPIVRAGIIALSNLAIFIVAHRWGERGLSRLNRWLCAVLSLALIVSTLPSGLMVNALSNGLMALIGFALGRGRVPWLPLAALGAAALFLQKGKEDLRDKYWFSANAIPLGLADYPDLLGDWIRFSFIEVTAPPDPTQTEMASASQSFVGRASLLQLFLRIQEMSPDPVPYLHGRTYAIIPQLLVPRVLDGDKKRAHLGTYLLAMDYGLQTSEDTLTTTIGFGLINEAMANFGYGGCLGLGITLGTFYGMVARWSSGCPLLSLRSLLAVLVLSLSFQNEFSASVYITTLFQGTCVLLALAPLTMRRPRPAASGLQPALVGAAA
jgi:hypothetical protein